MKKLYLLGLIALLWLPVAAKEDDSKLFSLYPVPLATNTLTVKIQDPANIASFELRTLIGKKLQEKKYSGNEQEILFTDMSQYYSGLYVVVAKDAAGKIVETLKFTINR
jgi:hypothetical protein